MKVKKELRKKDTKEKKSKFRVPKVVWNTFISIAVLLVLMVGAGAAYVYVIGDDPVENAATEEPVKPVVTEPDFMKSRQPAPDADVGVSTQMITSPVAPGANASITVRTLRGAECSILVEYDEVKSDDSGLVPRISDEYGMASWTWTVEETVPEGEWPVEVTCSRNEKSGMVRGMLEVDSDANAIQ